MYGRHFFSAGGWQGLRKGREEVRRPSNISSKAKVGRGETGLARQSFVSSPFFGGLSVPLAALFPTSICMLFPTSVCDFTEWCADILCARFSPRALRKSGINSCFWHRHCGRIDSAVKEFSMRLWCAADSQEPQWSLDWNVCSPSARHFCGFLLIDRHVGCALARLAPTLAKAFSRFAHSNRRRNRSGD